MPSLAQITKDLKKRNKNLDGLTDDLVASLVLYQNKYENLLLKTPFSLDPDGKLKRTTGNFNKAQSLNPMQKLGFNDISVSWVKEYPGVAKDQILFNKRLGFKTSIDFKDISLVKVYQNVDLGAMLAAGRGMDALIKRELVNAIALEENYSKAVDNIALGFLGAGDKLGQAANWADSTMRTSIFGLTRSIDNQIYEDIGEKEFIYTGALDKRTRPFCRSRVGKTFTKEQIEEFGRLNGSGLPGMFSPGGFRCRHSLIGVSAIDD